MRVTLLFLILFINSVVFAQNNSTNFWMGKSTGKLPALLYGLGDDRLGGTKMGYIDSNVLLRIVDSTKEFYTIQLSKWHHAYIEKGYIRHDSIFPTKPYYLTSSFMVKGDSLYDYVSIHMDEYLPYKSWMEIEPSKIMIDLYGVQSNTNWITQLQTIKEIKNVYYNQV